MRSYLKSVLVAANVVLAAGLAFQPAASQADPLVSFRDCCQGEGADAFCCDGCCWFVNDCEGGGACDE